MRVAALVLASFAALWAGMALRGLHAPGWTLIGPVLVSLGLAAAVFQEVPAERRDTAEGRRIGRLLTLAVVGEGIGILAGVNLVAWMGRPDLSMTVVAAVVGLHFLPLARWIPARVYFGSAAGLLACAGAGLLVAEPMRDVVICGGAALVLWATIASFFVVRRPRAVYA